MGVVVDPTQIARDRRGRRHAVVGVALDDLVPQRAQDLDGLLQRRRRLALQPRDDAGRDAPRVGDPQPRRRRLGGLRELQRRGGRGLLHGVAGRAHAVQKKGGVSDVARQHPVDRQPVPGSRFGGDRNAVALGLESEQPTPRRRDADRAHTVGAERCTDEARRHRRRAAAAGSPRRVLTVPGVARHAEGGRLGERPDRQLGDVRLADHHRPRGAQAAHQLGVRLLRAAVRVGAEGRHLARHVDVVLDCDRDYAQRPFVPRSAAPVGLICLHARALGEDHAKAVQRAVHALDALEI